MLRRIFFPEAPASVAVRYGFAGALCALTFFFRVFLEPVLLEHSPLVLFAVPVALSAIRGGFGPGLFATVVGDLAGFYFFPPSGSFSMFPQYATTAALQLAAFSLVGLTVSWFGSELRSLRAQALDTVRQRNEILESITDGFEALDARYRFVYVNRVSEQMLGKPRAELTGRIIWDEWPEARGTVVEQKLREVVERREPVHFEFFSEASGKWLELHGYPARSGGFTVYLRDISGRKQSELRLRDTLAERDTALEHVRLLSGMLPICAACKRIRDDRGTWQPLESYISNHSEAQFSHGMCPACAREYYGEAAARLLQ